MLQADMTARICCRLQRHSFGQIVGHKLKAARCKQQLLIQMSELLCEH